MDLDRSRRAGSSWHLRRERRARHSLAAAEHDLVLVEHLHRRWIADVDMELVGAAAEQAAHRPAHRGHLRIDGPPRALFKVMASEDRC
jgi:hypothetical protein